VIPGDAHIVLLSPDARYGIWEERLRLTGFVNEVILATDHNAVKNPDICFYITGDQSDQHISGVIKNLIRKQVHTFVIGNPARFLDSAGSLATLSEEAGALLHFSLWGLYQPGLRTLVQHIRKPEIIHFDRTLRYNSDGVESSPEMIPNELLLAAVLNPSPVADIHFRKTTDAVSVSLVYTNRSISTLIIRHDISPGIRRTVFGQDVYGEQLVTANDKSWRLVKNGKNVLEKSDAITLPADEMITSFLKSVRGMIADPVADIQQLRRLRPLDGLMKRVGI